MIDKTIAELEARIQRTDAVNPETRSELLQLLGTLRKEIAELPETQGEQAQSIARFADVSAHEVFRQTRDPQLVKLSLDGLSTSVSDFEKTHPNLVQVVNRICQTLANLGI